MRYILVLLLVGCGTQSTQNMDTTTILSQSSEDDSYSKLAEMCEHLPAHITRSQLGNRPIVVDGVSFYCF